MMSENELIMLRIESEFYIQVLFATFSKYGKNGLSKQPMAIC